MLICLLLVAVCRSADANAWKSRTIYQLLTDRYWRSNGDTQTPCNLSNYCGGDWEGIIQQLSYIKDLGFDAIWISPVVDNMDPGYHGYSFRNWEMVNGHFGDEASLKKMIDAAHSMGIWVMADVVANHVAPVGDDFSTIYPFNQGYHYHSDCAIEDWKNQWQLEHCRLANLPDLNQTQPFVRQYLINWIKQHVSKFGFDGVRIDTTRHVEKPFWTEYARSAGVYTVGEIFNDDDSVVGDYQNYIDGTLNYGMYFTIKDVFSQGKSMNEIAQRWETINKYFKNPDLLALFFDNHDNPRFLHDQPDWRLLKSTMAFTLTARGIPILYYGSEQGYSGGNDPGCREPLWTNMNKNHELYKFVQTLNRARAAHGAQSQPFEQKWVDDNLYAFTRGRFFVAVTNRVNMQVNVNVPNAGFSEGQNVCNIFNSGDCVRISGGKLPINLSNGEVKVYIPSSSSFFVSQRKTTKQILLEKNLIPLHKASKNQNDNNFSWASGLRQIA
jgi:alpha-amylase